MIIKTLSKKEARFADMIAYIDREIEPMEGFDQNFRIYHNIMGITKEDAIQSFQENYALKKQRKNGIAMFHEILSFHKEDPVTQKSVEDISKKYIELRAEEALVYGAIHTDKSHLHIHLIISSNVTGSSKAIRLNKKEFSDVRKSIELYQKEHYPELKKSLVYLDKGRKQSKSRDIDQKGREQQYKELQKRLSTEAQNEQRRKKTTDKERIYVFLYQSMQQSNSLEEFYQAVEGRGLEIYNRKNKPTGIVFKNRKFRFTTAVGKEKWKEFIEQDKRMKRLQEAREANIEKAKQKRPLTREERLKQVREQKRDGRERDR